MLHLGVYRFARKNIGYRSGYCRSCDMPRLRYRVREFLVANITFVPVLPLGFWKSWRCVTCDKDPDLRTRTQRGWLLVLAGLLALAFGLPMLYLVVTGRTEGHALELGGATLGVWAIIGGLVFAYRRMRVESPRAIREAQVFATSDDTCELCGSALRDAGGAAKPKVCERCGLERLG